MGNMVMTHLAARLRIIADDSRGFMSEDRRETLYSTAAFLESHLPAQEDEFRANVLSRLLELERWRSEVLGDPDED